MSSILTSILSLVTRSDGAISYGVIGATTFALYLALVQVFRYKIMKQNQKLNPRNLDDAFKIVRSLATREFPLMNTKSLEFGLFRTYAIPGISGLLAKTRELTERVSKRYDDTDIIVRLVLEHHVETPQTETGIRRLNYLHGRYSIPNHEMVYTLSVFTLEPCRWIDKYEYRTLTPNEKQALFVYWKEVGLRMGIKEIPETFAELEKFNVEYEKEKLVYAASNREVANATVAFFFAKMPNFTKGAAEACLRALMDPTLRKGMRYPDNSPFLEKFMHALLITRKYVVRYLCLPRFFPVVRTDFSPVPNQDVARSRLCTKLDEPIYKLTFNVFDDNYPHGYQIGNVGPSCCFNDGKLGKLGPKTTKAPTA